MGKKDKGALAAAKANKPKKNKAKYNNKKDKKKLQELKDTTADFGAENSAQATGEYTGSDKKEMKRRHEDDTPAFDLQSPPTEAKPAKKRKLEAVIAPAQEMEIDSEVEPDTTPKKLKTKKEKKEKKEKRIKRAEQHLPADEEGVEPKSEEKEKRAKKDKKDKKKKDKKRARNWTPESSGGEEEDAAEEEPKEDIAATTDDEAERPTPKMTKEERKAAKKLRKAETKQRREEEAAAAGPSSAHNADSDAEDTQPPKKVKKAKKAATLEKGKKAAKEEPPKTEEGGADLSERWNVQALEGGSTRQGKFMRLLGGKKHGATVANGDGPREHVDVDRVADDLQRQFDAGIRMKFESSGKRAGLGS